MSKADEALANVRRWLCDNLNDGDAGMACGMLSVVSRHVNELEAENAKLRELAGRMLSSIRRFEVCSDSYKVSSVYEQWMRELGVEVKDG